MNRTYNEIKSIIREYIGEGPVYLKDTTNKLQDAMVMCERAFLEDALRRNGGNITRTARFMKLNRSTIARMIKKHNVDIEDFKPNGYIEYYNSKAIRTIKN